MVARAQQRLHHGADGAHAGGEAQGRHAVFHLVDLVFQRGHGRVTLAAVAKARLLALEHGSELARVAVAEGDGGVHRLVQRAVLDTLAAIVMQDGGGRSRSFFYRS